MRQQVRFEVLPMREGGRQIDDLSRLKLFSVDPVRPKMFRADFALSLVFSSSYHSPLEDSEKARINRDYLFVTLLKSNICRLVHFK